MPSWEKEKVDSRDQVSMETSVVRQIDICLFNCFPACIALPEPFFQPFKKLFVFSREKKDERTVQELEKNK